ncbi:MAG TPA: tol-pal system protein YbgF [Candidatus Polarisedimenticolia bacterium]|nr:tol-pal system protein YbgF [Candidatus Polarisedimenticolia bacterium]
MKSVFALPVLAVMASAPACLTSTQATRLQTDLEEVKKQLFQIQQETAGTRSRIEEIDRKLGQGGAPAGPAQADLKATVQSLLDQNRVVSEQLKEIRSWMAGMSQTGRPAQGGPAGTAAAVPRPAGGDPGFASAYADYTKGNYELAMMGFSDFLKAHPDSPQAPEAQYWIGECLYSQGKFKEAAEAFDRCLSRYPGAQRVAPALLKKGYAQLEAGQTTQAVSTLQRLIESHPQSDEARLASERLQQLGLRSR